MYYDELTTPLRTKQNIKSVPRKLLSTYLLVRQALVFTDVLIHDGVKRLSVLPTISITSVECESSINS